MNMHNIVDTLFSSITYVFFWPIFIIFTLFQTGLNTLQSRYKLSHFTLTMSTQYTKTADRCKRKSNVQIADPSVVLSQYTNVTDRRPRPQQTTDNKQTIAELCNVIATFGYRSGQITCWVVCSLCASRSAKDRVCGCSSWARWSDATLHMTRWMSSRLNHISIANAWRRRPNEAGAPVVM